MYHDSAGVKDGVAFSWNQEVVDDILSRNPSMADTPFVVPLKRRSVGSSVTPVSPFHPKPITLVLLNASFLLIY